MKLENFWPKENRQSRVLVSFEPLLKGLRIKVCEPLLILGADKFKGLAIRVRVRGGGYVA